METAQKSKTKKQAEAKIIRLKTIATEKTSSTKYIQVAWNFAHSALWNTEPFSPKEKKQLQELLAAHFDPAKNSKQTCKEIIQRICLAKRYVARGQGRYITKPVDWLNIHYSKGLVGTAKWLEEVKEQRKTVPEYNKGITTLADAITSYTEQPGAYTFYRYRRLLIEQKQYDLLQLFYNSLINYQFLNA